MSKKNNDPKPLIGGGGLTYTSNSTYTVPTDGTYKITADWTQTLSSSVISNPTWVDPLQELRDLIEKNIECGALIDWDIKVKDTGLARKMYKEFMVKDGWLYAKKV